MARTDRPLAVGTATSTGSWALVHAELVARGLA